MAQTDIETLNLLPIKVATMSDQAKITGIVNQIMAAKKQNVDANTSKLEREIDSLVYSLYNLTPDEIRIVEEATAR